MRKMENWIGKREDNSREDNHTEALNQWHFQLFGLHMEVPGTWVIYPENRSQELSYEEGFLKFDHRRSKEKEHIQESVSVGLRWQRIREPISNDDFMRDYVEKLVKPDKKGKKSSIQIISQKKIHIGEQEAIFLECSYMASASLFRKNGIVVHVLNIAYLDIRSERTIIGTAAINAAAVEQYKDILTEILYSIHTD